MGTHQVEATPPVARVVTDVAGIDKSFDYLVPESLSDRVEVGSEVRLPLGGRRVGGWVEGFRSIEESDVDASLLRPLGRLRGFGPTPEILGLAEWAAWRWASRRSAFLRVASADRAVTRLPPPDLRRPAAPDRLPVDLPSEPGTHVLRLAPGIDATPVVAAAAQGGPLLVIVPTAARAAVLAARLRRAGAGVALLPDGWDRARSGAGVVIGARSAAWAPCPGLSAVVVVDGHDEALGAEGAPTWSAVTVAVERARRAGIACYLLSPCPTPEMLASGVLHLGNRLQERAGWATAEVLDRRGDDPRLGLYSERLVGLVREGDRVACVLNRTGRVRLLACSSCGEPARCEVCGTAVSSPEAGRLRCGRCGAERPEVCTVCTSTSMRALRIGVSRAREELERLAGRPVGEVTSSTRRMPTEDVLVGTEALLHRIDPSAGYGAIAFVDLDQELLAPRVTAPEEALALLAAASRLTRRGRLVLQTRMPDHPVVRAVATGDPSVAAVESERTRRALGFPPFRALAVVHGESAPDYVETLRTEPELSVIGPDGGRFLVRAADHTRLCDALARHTRPGGGTVRVAVDPRRY